MALYTVTNYSVSSILGWIQSGEIAIPEIQRPFVWKSTKVRDLVDSLYWGYPVGYLIVWKNHSVKLKDGSFSSGKKILIDGQQRITAIRAAISGLPVINENYQEKRICIAFNPLTEKFEVSNAAIRKDSAWIEDISEVFEPDFRSRRFLKQYCEINNIDDEDVADSLDERLSKLRQIESNTIGSIELDDELDIDRVTEIFIRINSQVAPLSQADFVMSKIAADSDNGGRVIRKSIDYFCHLLEKPEAFSVFKTNDPQFINSEDGQAICWAAKNQQTLYLPKYDDVLRVAFTFKFKIGKLAQLVGKLSGRNYTERTYDSRTVVESFASLHDAVLAVLNESNFRRFIMILKSAGFARAQMIRSKLAVNFSYSLFLFLKERNINPAEIEKVVRRWLVLSLLTGRYTHGSAETAIDKDIRLFDTSLNQGTTPMAVLEAEESTSLNEDFWNITLPDHLRASTQTNTEFCLFIASQVKAVTKGFLSNHITVRDMLEERGDVHHLFPKEYLAKAGFSKDMYNRVANYAITQTEINIQIRDRAPKDYMAIVLAQINGEEAKLGGIMNPSELIANLNAHAIPSGFETMDINNYEAFLAERQKLMAQAIKHYYLNL